MELTDQELDIIKAASREIDFGRITINFTGSPQNIVDIIPEKHLRFQRVKTADQARSRLKSHEQI